MLSVELKFLLFQVKCHSKHYVFYFQLLENNDWEDVQTLELPDVSRDLVSLLLDLIYVGVIEATIDDLRSIILLVKI
jgi:hypothetical protein